MFSNVSRPDSSSDEGVVVQVDSLRKSCKVKTVSGQNLDQVQWVESSGNSSRGGDRGGPIMGNRVLISYSLGYPVIKGYLPKLQTVENTFPIDIDSSQQLVDTGNYSGASGIAVGDANKPRDLLNGDRILASEGGAFISLLRAGSVLLRSSKLSQIFISKLDDVVKIISRNFEHYTDVSSDIVKNFQGRVYRYVGYTNSFAEAKGEQYRYHQYLGDVSAAEAVKTNYLSPPSVPAMSNLIFKEQVTDGGEKMRRTLNTSGEEILHIQGSGNLNRDSTSGHEILTVTGDTFSKRTTTPETTIISFNDANTITVNDPVIELKRSDGALVLLNSSGITISFAGSQSTYTTAGVNIGFGSHHVNIDSSGVHLG